MKRYRNSSHLKNQFKNLESKITFSIRNSKLIIMLRDAYSNVRGLRKIINKVETLK